LKARLGPTIRAQLNPKLFNKKAMIQWNDVVWTRMCHNVSPPCDQNGYCLTNQDAQQILYLANKEGQLQKWLSPLSAETNRLSIGPFIAELVDSLQRSASGRREPKFELYSGHDTNIWIMLGIFKAKGTARLWPPYASNFIMELWRDDNTGQYKVRVIYNGSVLDSDLCDFRQGCDLQTLSYALQQSIPGDLWRECQQQ